MKIHTNILTVGGALLAFLPYAAPFTCDSSLATPTDPNGADPNQIGETGCRIFNSCPTASELKLARSTRWLSPRSSGFIGASSLECPDTFGCYSVATTSGTGLYCLDLNSWDYIDGQGVCGNVLTGQTVGCGSSSGGSGAADGNTGGGNGGGSGPTSGTGTGSGSGNGNGSGTGTGNGNGNGSGAGNGSGPGKPNEAGRVAISHGLANSWMGLVAFFGVWMM